MGNQLDVEHQLREVENFPHSCSPPKKRHFSCLCVCARLTCGAGIARAPLCWDFGSAEGAESRVGLHRVSHQGCLWCSYITWRALLLLQPLFLTGCISPRWFPLSCLPGPFPNFFTTFGVKCGTSALQSHPVWDRNSQAGRERWELLGNPGQELKLPLGGPFRPFLAREG